MTDSENVNDNVNHRLNVDDGEANLGQQDTATAIAQKSETSNADTTSANKEHEINKNSATSNNGATAKESKKLSVKERMRRLQQQRNQADQLNQLAVKEEANRHLGRLTNKYDNKAEQFTAPLSTRALTLAQKANVDVKVLTEQASDAIQKAQSKAEKSELNKYGVNDYHNPEGQFRHYQRDLKSLPQYQGRQDDNVDEFGNVITVATSSVPTDTTYDPLQLGDDNKQSERQGARRLANEMYRRIDKAKQRDEKRKERENDSDVSYINQRNKRFNQKINRTYDKSTAEIRENLERGTAL